MMTQRRLLRLLVSGAFGSSPEIERVGAKGIRTPETLSGLIDNWCCGLSAPNRLALKGSSVVLDEKGSTILQQYLEYCAAKQERSWSSEKTIEQLKKEVG